MWSCQLFCCRLEENIQFQYFPYWIFTGVSPFFNDVVQCIVLCLRDERIVCKLALAENDQSFFHFSTDLFVYFILCYFIFFPPVFPDFQNVHLKSEISIWAFLTRPNHLSCCPHWFITLYACCMSTIDLFAFERIGVQLLWKLLSPPETLAFWSEMKNGFIYKTW